MKRTRSDLIDHTGQRFGAWTVIRYTGAIHYPGGGRDTGWLCRCDCGTEKVVPGNQLRFGRSRRCRACTRVPAELRRCLWCKRPTKKNDKARECAACERMALRNGRDPEGRPVSKGRRRVLVEA